MALTGKQIRAGAFWTYGGHFVTTAVHFAIGIVLARILGPSEFGVFVAVTAFTSVLLMVAQFGLPAAILQAKQLTDENINSAFWTITVLALACIALIWFIATPLSTIYVASDFQPVMLLMSAIFLIIPFNCVGLSLLRRRMQFDRVARMDIITISVVGPIEIVAALLGAGVYSLWLGTIGSMLTTSILIWRNLDWRPALPSFAPVKALLRYSSYTTVNTTLSFLTGRVDNMIVGGLLGARNLGLYDRAYSLARMPSQELALSLGPLVMGSFAKIQDDIERSRHLYFKAASALSTITLPFLAFVLVAGPEALVFVYGEAWADSGTPLQIMVPGAVFLLLSLTMRSVARAQGLVKEEVPIGIAELLVTAVGVAVLIPFGLAGVALAITIREAVSLALTSRLLGRSALALTPREIAFAVAPGLIAFAVACAGGYITLMEARAGSDGLFTLLMWTGLSMFAIYGLSIGLMMLFWRQHAYLAHTRQLIAESLADFLELRKRLRPA
jgi:O-antigen/teichoic acid export membrane protein